MTTDLTAIDAKLDRLIERTAVLEAQQAEALRRQDEALIRLGKVEDVGLAYQLHRAEMRPFEKVVWGVIGTAVTAFSVGIMSAILQVMK